MPGLGHKSYIQIGPKETTFGTFQTPTKKLEVESWSISPEIGVIEDASLYAAQSRRGLYQGGLLYKGTFVVRLNYDGILELLRGVLGTYSSAVVEGSVRDHTFLSDGTTSSTLNSYSFEVVLGDVPAGKVSRLLGAKLTGMTIRGTAGNGNDAMLTVEFTVLAKDYQSDQTQTGSLTFPAVLPVLYHHTENPGGVVDDGTADAVGNVRWRSFEIAIASPHTEDRFYLGSHNIDEPLRSDFLDVTWRQTQEFITKTQLEAARAFTPGSPRLVFQHPTTIGSASKREFEIRSGSAQLTEFSPPIEGYGVLISTATWRAFYDPTDTAALLVRVRNTEAALS
jgi:hypothetical protein